MAYQGFAYWYDSLNREADYDRLCARLCRILREQGISGGIVADLGCGTGEVSLRLARAGYDMLAVDASADMLSVFREKLGEAENAALTDTLLLCQDLAELDLYGTIRGAVSTFDTLNHLPPEKLDAALGRAALFMEPGGVLVFDANTPYKHREVLANHCFELETPELVCVWQNIHQPENRRVQIELEGFGKDGRPLFFETFHEYSYTRQEWEVLLLRHGFRVLEIQDGETFLPLREDTQRYLFTARKES